MKEIKLDAVVENIPRATAFVDEALEQLNCPMKAQMQIDVAVDELFANVSQYAYAPGRGSVTLQFDYDEQNKTASITFIDSGVPYDPLEKEDPDTSLPADKRTIGGLGIFLVKKTMDDFIYKRENGFNIVCIRKRLG